MGWRKVETSSPPRRGLDASGLAPWTRRLDVRGGPLAMKTAGLRSVSVHPPGIARAVWGAVGDCRFVHGNNGPQLVILSAGTPFGKAIEHGSITEALGCVLKELMPYGGTQTTMTVYGKPLQTAKRQPIRRRECPLTCRRRLKIW
ncbi:MAG: hypothetical protein JO307_02345 [Bryobacterales bacterium]|nr:hypothetical protein [Bryobacterales bacterium]MBV9398551.1 hypothetical protein [Bryobacterales bacterium]